MGIPEHATLIITGASRGIGCALAGLLAERGHNLVLNGRDGQKLHEVERECSDISRAAQWDKARFSHVAGDCSRAEVVRELAAKARELGGLYGFFHVAGVLAPGPALWELSEEDYDAVMDASVRGAYQLIRFTMPALIARGEGLAVFFGSGAATRVQPGIAAYCAAKAAEEHMARQLAAEAPEVASIIFQPSIVETRMQVQARESEGERSEGLRQVFRSWKDKGMLLTPEESARQLLDFLNTDIRSLSGEMVRAK